MTGSWRVCSGEEKVSPKGETSTDPGKPFSRWVSLQSGGWLLGEGT